MLAEDDVDRFVRDGVVVLRGAVDPADVATLWSEVASGVRSQGVVPEDPTTWSVPVVRVPTPVGPASARAASAPALAEASDRLLGAGRWVPPGVLGGTVPVRLPHPDDPGDAGWHVDAGVAGPEGLRIHRDARGRALVVLVLLTDVGPDDAPTELLLGSQRDVAPVLDEVGDDGIGFVELAASLPARVHERPSAWATGRAGDVVLAHPFLLHRATWPHRGTRPRAVAQAGVAPVGPLDPHRPDPSPAEAALLPPAPR